MRGRDGTGRPEGSARGAITLEPLLTAHTRRAGASHPLPHRLRGRPPPGQPAPRGLGGGRAGGGGAKGSDRAAGRGPQPKCRAAPTRAGELEGEVIEVELPGASAGGKGAGGGGGDGFVVQVTAPRGAVRALPAALFCVGRVGPGRASVSFRVRVLYRPASSSGRAGAGAVSGPVVRTRQRAPPPGRRPPTRPPPAAGRRCFLRFRPHAGRRRAARAAADERGRGAAAAGGVRGGAHVPPGARARPPRTGGPRGSARPPLQGWGCIQLALQAFGGSARGPPARALRLRPRFFLPAGGLGAAAGAGIDAQRVLDGGPQRARAPGTHPAGGRPPRAAVRRAGATPGKPNAARTPRRR